MNRKYENGFIIINNSNKYNFYKIRIYRKARTRKNDINIKYECDVWYKGRENSNSMLMVLNESTIDEILENINK